jgi:serine/threonine protein kinase/ABC-type branched-subunit amino acid transport system substrate-binding protein
VDIGVPGIEDAEEIGSGGFGWVYRARQPAFAREVAVKLLRGRILDERVLERFQRECSAIGVVSSHPNIVTVHDAGTTPTGYPYIVMEFLSSGSLGDRLEREGPLDWREAVRIGIKMAGALHTAHLSGVLHRDLKPENILVSEYGEPLLADFGIARIVGAKETTAGVITASFAHAPPEVVAGQRPDARGDIYSLGSMLHALLTGSPPFLLPDDDNVLPMIARISTVPPPDLRPYDIPEPLITAIEAAMEKLPRNRPETALAFGRQLQAAQQVSGEVVTRLRVPTDEAHIAPPELPTVRLHGSRRPPPSPRPGHEPPRPQPAPFPVGPTVIRSAPAAAGPLPTPEPVPSRRRSSWQMALGALACVIILGVGIAAYANGNRDGTVDTAKPAGGGSTIGSTAVDTSITATPTGSGSKAGALDGLKGTTPLVNVSQDFKTNLDGQGLDLERTYNYGAETYDAVVVLALAALSARTDGIAMARQINAVTRSGSKCQTFQACSNLVKAGTSDIDYDGVSGPLDFSGNGEPTMASYGVQHFVASNRIDDAKTTFKAAKAPAYADVPQVNVEGSRAGNGTLKIGTLLPVTGSLAFLGPPEVAGARLALKDINAAGGVLGKNVELSEGDSSDAQNPTVATQTVDRLLGESADAIIGAASSSVTLNVIDKIVGAGVVMFSPANTSKRLSTYADKGLYFRNAPSDILQGQVLSEVIADDNITSVGILALNDAYGTGLADDFTKSFTASGGKVVEKIIYDPKAQTFDNEVDRIKAANPAGIVLIGFDESSRILASMVEKGIGPKAKKIYGVDGNIGNTLGENFDAGK